MERLFDTVPEYTQEVQAEVKGDLPLWLNGRLFRIGPGKFDLGDFTLSHWFDGCALLNCVTIQDGKVSYKSRFLTSEAYQKMTKVQRPVFTEFGTRSFPDPCKNVFSRFLSQLVPIEMTDNTVANIFPLGQDIFCSSETTHLWKIDQDTLEAVERTDVSKVISINMASSHPQCSRDGTIYNLGASLMTGLKYNIIKIPPSEDKVLKGSKMIKTASVLCTVPTSWKTCLSYYHSFAMTEKYLIFMEQPLLINTVKLVTSGMKGQALKECFDWEPKEKTRFIVIEKENGRCLKTRYMAEALFSFHQINAYEEDNQIIMDVICFDDIEIINKFYLSNLRTGNFDTTAEPQPRRFVIPLKTDGRKGENLVNLKDCKATAVKQDSGVIFLSHEMLSTPGYELPTINPEYNGLKYRYLYASGVFERATFHNALLKLDVETKEFKTWRDSDTMFPGEMAFIPTPNCIDEDDGILITMVIDTEPDRPDFFLVLDAKTFKEIARADLPVSVRVPLAFHGMYQAKK